MTSAFLFFSIARLLLSSALVNQSVGLLSQNLAQTQLATLVTLQEDREVAPH